MPTLQQKDLIEKLMNIHWSRLENSRKVIDNSWDRKSIGITRREHYYLNNKRVEKDNLKLYKNLCGIRDGKVESATKKEMEGGYDPKFVKQMAYHRDWQRQHDRSERQSVIDKENQIIYKSLKNMPSAVPSASSLAKEYVEKHKIVNTYTHNKVKPYSLHLELRRYRKYGSKSQSPTRPKSASPPTQHTASSRMKSQPVDLSEKNRLGIRPKSACRMKSSEKTKKKWSRSKRLLMKNEIHKMYKKLTKRAASKITADDVAVYDNEGQIDHDIKHESFQLDESDALRYDDNLILDSRDDRLGCHNTESSSGNVARALFRDTESVPGLESRNAKAENKDATPQISDVDRIDAGNCNNQNIASNLCNTSDFGEQSPRALTKSICRRHLFTETQLEAPIKCRTGSDSGEHSNQDCDANSYFVVRMYDVGESCDLRLLSPVRNGAGDSPYSPPGVKGGNNGQTVSSPPESPLSLGRSRSRPIAVATSSGVLIECRLHPETERTRSHELFISMPDLKAMIKRSFAKKSKLWQACRSITCRNKERALYDCLSDHLTLPLQDQLCGLLAKKIELLVTVDSALPKELEFAERVNVGFKFQL